MQSKAAPDDEHLARLDILESVHLPTGYIRERIDVETDAGVVSAAVWAYFKPRERIARIHSDPHDDYQDRRYVPAAAHSSGA